MVMISVNGCGDGCTLRVGPQGTVHEVEDGASPSSIQIPRSRPGSKAAKTKVKVKVKIHFDDGDVQWSAYPHKDLSLLPPNEDADDDDDAGDDAGGAGGSGSATVATVPILESMGYDHGLCVAAVRCCAKGKVSKEGGGGLATLDAALDWLSDATARNKSTRRRGGSQSTCADIGNGTARALEKGKEKAAIPVVVAPVGKQAKQPTKNQEQGSDVLNQNKKAAVKKGHTGADAGAGDGDGDAMDTGESTASAASAASAPDYPSATTKLEPPKPKSNPKPTPAVLQRSMSEYEKQRLVNMARNQVCVYWYKHARARARACAHVCACARVCACACVDRTRVCVRSFRF